MLKSLKIIVAISCGFAAYFIGKEMRSMPLWGDWTLYLLLSSWACLLTVYSFFISPLSNSDKLIAYSILSGVLLWLGF
ncbi:MAG: hypothetical protein RI894_2046, partial [Bacteroidota bacterium]